MTHAEFVEGCQSKRVDAHVNKLLALKLMDTALMPKRYRVAYLFWTWIWFVSVPAAIACFIWTRWWIGVIVLFVGWALPEAIRRSACEFVLEQALEDEGFYNAAVKVGALTLTLKQ